MMLSKAQICEDLILSSGNEPFLAWTLTKLTSIPNSKLNMFIVRQPSLGTANNRVLHVTQLR